MGEIAGALSLCATRKSEQFLTRRMKDTDRKGVKDILQYVLQEIDKAGK